MKHLYVHVPFCQEICAYCDFFRVRCHDGLIDQYLKGLAAELDHYGKYKETEIETIYLGGGTPSALSAHQLAQLLELLAPFARHVKEYTFEANPESLTKEKIELLAMYGINRVSLGVQTLEEEILKLIHRLHQPADVLRVIDQLHASGIHNISIDMMYGLPKQTLSMWEQHLNEIAMWPISHVSIYSLTIEEHSEFGRQQMNLIDNEIEGLMFEKGIEVLHKHGFHQYEISNFAKEVKDQANTANRSSNESQHNKGYWLVEDYLGVGPGAHGSIDAIRYENTQNINDYIHGTWIMKQETISMHNRMFEVIMLGLRMNEGVSLHSFKECFNVELIDIYQKAIDTNINEGMLELVDGYVRTTKKGMLLLHTVLLPFMDE